MTVINFKTGKVYEENQLDSFPDGEIFRRSMLNGFYEWLVWSAKEKQLNAMFPRKKLSKSTNKLNETK